MPAPVPSRRIPWIGAILLAVTAGGGYVATRPSAPTGPEPVAVIEPPAAPVVVPTISAAPTEPVLVVAANATPSPTWQGIPVTVVCPTSTDDTSLRAACPEYFTGGWKTAAVRDGYTSGSQKLAKVDCAMDHLDKLDAVTRESLTCRDSLNAAIYGQGGSGGGLCATEIATLCRGVHPTPGSNPTDICLQDQVTKLSAACATAVANHAYAEAAIKASR